MDKRDFKTHPQQWQAILDFGEQNPSIFRPQFKHGEGDATQHAKLWEQLVDKLNSMGFGFRSVEKWKMAIGRWKSKTKSKAAQLRTEAKKTGGGSSAAIPLTEIEERLMNLMGWRSVSGDGNVELGMKKPYNIQATPQPLPEPQLSPRRELPSEPQFSSRQELPSEPQPSTSSAMGPAKSPPPLASLNRPSRKRSRLSNEKSKKFVSLAKMHQEALDEKKKLREIATRQAEAQEAMSRTLRDFFNYYKMKDIV